MSVSERNQITMLGYFHFSTPGALRFQDTVIRNETLDATAPGLVIVRYRDQRCNTGFGPFGFSSTGWFR